MEKINKWTCDCGEVYTSDTTSQLEANCLECGKKIIRDDRLLTIKKSETEGEKK